MAKLKEILQQIRERTTPEQARFVNDNMAIIDYIYELMAEKNMKPIDLAKALGKTPAEISKWLSGTHNLTLLSLTKIAIALDEAIIMTPAQAKSKYETVKYIPLAVSGNVNKQRDTFSPSYTFEETTNKQCGNFKFYIDQNERSAKQYSN